MRGKSICYWHDPEHATEAAEARRLGGLHRRKVTSLAAIYDFAGLRTLEGAQRLLETAVLETLALENSIPRNRVLIAAAQAAPRLVETAELVERLDALEIAAGLRPRDEREAAQASPP